MNLNQVQRLMATVPQAISPRQRQRVEGYAATCRQLSSRIDDARHNLERILREMSEGGDPDALAQQAIDVLIELDELERIQPRIDAWLRVAVGALEDEIQGGPVGEGPI